MNLACARRAASAHGAPPACAAASCGQSSLALALGVWLEPAGQHRPWARRDTQAGAQAGAHDAMASEQKCKGWARR
jgi:hypothetical protein